MTEEEMAIVWEAFTADPVGIRYIKREVSEYKGLSSADRRGLFAYLDERQKTRAKERAERFKKAHPDYHKEYYEAHKAEASKCVYTIERPKGCTWRIVYHSRSSYDVAMKWDAFVDYDKKTRLRMMRHPAEGGHELLKERIPEEGEEVNGGDNSEQ